MPGPANRHGDANPTGITAAITPSTLTNDDLLGLVQEACPTAAGQIAHDELTIFVGPDDLVGVLRHCRDHAELSCELLADLSGVHWPSGDKVIERQPSTTGWPEYRVEREVGAIEVSYLMRSVTRNHWFRVSVAVDDTEPRLPSVTGLYPTANWHEREVFDMFGVDFVGHPDLSRILMPEDWLGHPHRKDYPLGGVDIDYKNDKHIPPPHERSLREVVR